MKIRELFDRVMAMPGIPLGTVGEDMLLMWLNECEGKIFLEVISARMGYEGEAFEGYGDEDTEQILLAADPYSVLYAHWLCAQIYLAYADTARYNNFMALYEDAYEDFTAWYARGHRQKLGVEVKL